MEMKKLTFEIQINAPVEKVWNVMLDKDTYEQWTTEFSEGSTYDGSWEQGAEILFLGPDGGGMIAEIAELRKFKFVSIRHLGMIENGEADLERGKDWDSAYENYTFEAKDGGTHLTIHQDMLPEYEEMFLEMWPRALKKLKEICERQD
jgi:uncharacterized protein YndB with AHSA1/START domain